MAIRAVFVDVDGTTADTEPRNRRAIEEAARIGGFHIKPGDWNHLAGQGDSIIWEAICNEKPDFKEVFNTGVSFERACLNAKLDRINEVKKIQETADAIDLFKGVREHPIYVAAVSNSIKGDAQASLRHAGYQDSDFIFELFRDDLRAAGLRPKPHPDPYIEALRRLNETLADKAKKAGETFIPITPEECLVLEDSKTGARAGLHAGMHTVQMTDESPGLDTEESAEMEVHYNSHYYPVSRAGLVPKCRELLGMAPG